MPRPVPRTDVLLSVFGAPHQSDLVTSALRLTTALLDRGARVQLWACGDATRLTYAVPGDAKPRDLADWERTYPTVSRIARDLVADHPGRLHWYVCRFCAAERGVAEQPPEVSCRSPFAFGDHVRAADRALVLGRC